MEFRAGRQRKMKMGRKTAFCLFHLHAKSCLQHAWQHFWLFIFRHALQGAGHRFTSLILFWVLNMVRVSHNSCVTLTLTKRRCDPAGGASSTTTRSQSSLIGVTVVVPPAGVHVPEVIEEENSAW